MAKPASDGDSGRAARLSLPLTPEGTVDWDHVRPSTAAKFLDIIKTDPEVKNAYSIGNGEGQEQPAIFDEITQESVSQGLDTLQNANATIFRILTARFVKHPLLRDQAGKPVPLILDQQTLDTTFKLTAKQHDELDPRATRLAKKYSSDLPEWLKKNLDLYLFCSMFLAYTAQNAKAAMGLQIKRDLANAQRNFAAAQANQPKNPQPDSDVKPPTPPEGSNGKAERNKEIIDPILNMIQKDGEQPPNQPLV
jgi:hypothetical protein